MKSAKRLSVQKLLVVVVIPLLLSGTLDAREQQSKINPPETKKGRVVLKTNSGDFLGNPASGLLGMNLGPEGRLSGAEQQLVAKLGQAKADIKRKLSDIREQSPVYPRGASEGQKMIIDFQRDVTKEIRSIRARAKDPVECVQMVEEFLRLNRPGFREAEEFAGRNLGSGLQ